MDQQRISGGVAIPSKYLEINDHKIHYLEAGQGKPIIFLHSMPLSSYSWRNVIPYLSTLGRCIAPDFLGMGKSDKPDIKYTIADHISYLEAFINALKLKRITIVMHGWGSIPGFHYAMNNEKNCRALVFYEAFLRTLDGKEISLPFQEQINEMQENAYNDVANAGVAFVDNFLPQQIMRSLSTEELQQYRAPFIQNGSAKALRQYINEVGTTAGRKMLDKIIADYTKTLTHSRLPKLMLYTVPGFITTVATIVWAKEHLKNLEVIDLGEELHLAQEASPQLMGEAISVWLQGLEATSK